MTDQPEILFARLDAKEVVEKAEAMFAARKAETEGPAEEEAGEEQPAEGGSSRIRHIARQSRHTKGYGFSFSTGNN